MSGGGDRRSYVSDPVCTRDAQRADRPHARPRASVFVSWGGWSHIYMQMCVVFICVPLTLNTSLSPPFRPMVSFTRDSAPADMASA